MKIWYTHEKIAIVQMLLQYNDLSSNKWIKSKKMIAIKVSWTKHFISITLSILNKIHV